MEEEKKKVTAQQKYDRLLVGWFVVGGVAIAALIAVLAAGILLSGEDGPTAPFIGGIFGVLGVFIVVMLVYALFLGRAQTEMAREFLYWQGNKVSVKTPLDAVSGFGGRRRIKTPVTFSEEGFAWENQSVSWDRLTGEVGYTGNDAAGKAMWYVCLHAKQGDTVLFFWCHVKNYTLLRRFCKSYIAGMAGLDASYQKLLDPARPLPPLPSGSAEGEESFVETSSFEAEGTSGMPPYAGGMSAENGETVSPVAADGGIAADVAENVAAASSAADDGGGLRAAYDAETSAGQSATDGAFVRSVPAGFASARFCSFRWLWWPLYYVVVLGLGIGIGVLCLFGGLEGGTAVAPVIGVVLAVVGTHYFYEKFPKGTTVIDGRSVRNTAPTGERVFPVEQTRAADEGFYIAFYYGAEKVSIFNTKRARAVVCALPFLQTDKSLFRLGETDGQNAAAYPGDGDEGE